MTGAASSMPCAIWRDLHHRSFAVTAERRQLLWAEMDRCLALADRLADAAGADRQDP